MQHHALASESKFIYVFLGDDRKNHDLKMLECAYL